MSSSFVHIHPGVVAGVGLVGARGGGVRGRSVKHDAAMRGRERLARARDGRSKG